MNKSALYFGGVVAALLLAGCGPEDHSTTISTQSQHLTAQPTSVKVERKDIVGYLLLDGKLYTPPNADVVVRAPYDAPVQQIAVQPGQRVDRGELLVKMSLPDQQQYFAQAQQTLKTAQTAYANAQITFEQPLREAQRQLAQARSTERTLRQQAAAGGDAGDVQQATDSRQEAEEAYLEAKANANEKMLPYKQQLDAAQIAYKQAKSGEMQANVASPISGTVVDIQAQSGQEAKAGAPIVHVVDLSRIQVKADLTPDQAAYVDKDKDVVVSFMGLEDKSFNGSVTDVRTLPADTTGVKREVTIDFKNDAGLVKPQMQVKSVGIKIGEARDALAVPVDAVFHDKNGNTCVRVMDKGQWTVRAVVTGLSDGFLTQIKSGVDEGDTVRVPGEM